MSDEIRCYESHDSMSGTVTNDSESGEVQEFTRRLVIGRVRDFDTVVEEMTNKYAPRYIVSERNGKYWVRKKLSPKGIGNRYWDVSAEYQTLIAKNDGEEGGDDGSNPMPGGIAWETTGRTERIYQAKEETAYPEGSPSLEGAINVSGNAVEGIDVPVPGMRYSETWILPASLAMSYDYMNAVFDLTGTCNVSTFRLFQPGEALFMGARTQWQSDQPYATVAFEFEARRNVEEFYPCIGFGAAFPKEGWEYVWMTYKYAVDGNKLLRRPDTAYKNRIFSKVSWAGLVIAGLEKPGRPVNPMVPVAWNNPWDRKVDFGGPWGEGLGGE